MSTDCSTTLEISHPSVTCGHCRFQSALDGEFTVEDGRLTWRASPDPQPRRGPDFLSCCESSPVIRFEHIDADGKDLSDAEITTLRDTAEKARAEEMRRWHDEEP